MECVKHLAVKAGEEYVAGAMIQAFIKYMENDSSRPEEALDIALKKNDVKFDFITSSIVTGSKIDLHKYLLRAIELSKHSDTKIKNCAIYALGQISYEENILINNSVEAIKSIVCQDYNIVVFSSALTASYSLYKQCKSLEKTVIEIFQVILKEKDDDILHTASELLFFEATKIPESIVKLLLAALSNTKPQNIRTIDNIDQGLQIFFKKGYEDIVISFLENILLDNREISIKQFDSLSREIANSQDHLNMLITRWLLSKNVRLGRCVSDLLPFEPEGGIALSVDKRQLSDFIEGVHVFLAKKACGWLFINHQISATAFIISLIELAPDKDIKSIIEILFNPLLISYPGSVKDYLNRVFKSASEKITYALQKLFDKFEKYHKALQSTCKIKELHPSQAHREAHNRWHSRLMLASHEEASKNSILSMIATHSVLLYGKKSIYYIHHGPKDQGTRQETPLQEFSFSVELPAMDVLNHNQLQLTLQKFKLEGCIS